MSEVQPAQTWEEVLAEPLTTVRDEGWRIVQTVEELSPRPQQAPLSMAPPQTFVMTRSLPQPDEEPASVTLPPSLAEQLSLTWAARRRRPSVEEPAQPKWPVAGESPQQVEGPPAEATHAASPQIAAAAPNLIMRVLRRLTPRLGGAPQPEAAFSPAATIVAQPNPAASIESFLTTPPTVTEQGEVAISVSVRPGPQPLRRSEGLAATHISRNVEVMDWQETARTQDEGLETAVAWPVAAAQTPLVLRDTSVVASPPGAAPVSPSPSPPAAGRAQATVATAMAGPATPTVRQDVPSTAAQPAALRTEPTFATVLKRIARGIRTPGPAPLAESASAPGLERQTVVVTAAPALQRQVDSITPTPTAVPEEPASAPRLVHLEAAKTVVSMAAPAISAGNENQASEPVQPPRASPAAAPGAISGPAKAGAGAQARPDEGEPFSPVLRARIGHLVDVPLKNVRVFRNQAAANLTRQLGADAATVGDAVYVARGQGNPGLPTGQALLAHELAHAAPEAVPSPEASGVWPDGRDPATSAGPQEAHALRLEHAVQRRDLAAPPPPSIARGREGLNWEDGLPTSDPVATNDANAGGYRGDGSGYVNITTPFASSGSGPGGGRSQGGAVALAESDRPAVSETTTTAATDSGSAERSKDEEASLVERAVEAVLRRLRRDAVIDSERRGAFRSELGG